MNGRSGVNGLPALYHVVKALRNVLADRSLHSTVENHVWVTALRTGLVATTPVLVRSSIMYNTTISLSIQNSILRLAVCILHPTETQSPSHIQNAKDTPTITSLRNYNYVIPPTKWPARAPYRALPAIRWPHAGRHLALVTFVHPT